MRGALPRTGMDIVERRAEMFEKLFWDKMYSTYERGVFLWTYHYVW